MESESLTLTGRRAFVTGGSRGIGLESVRALAHAGAEVMYSSRSPSGLDEAARALGFHTVGLYAKDDTSAPIVEAQGFSRHGSMEYWARDV